MKTLMICLRFLLEIFLTIVLFPLIVFIALIWLGYCIAACKLYECNKKEGFKVWLKYLKTGIDMNLDFIINGI